MKFFSPKRRIPPAKPFKPDAEARETAFRPTSRPEAPRLLNPISEAISKHRRAIEGNEQRIISMEKDRDVTLLSLGAELSEARRAFDATTRRIEAEMRQIDGATDRRVALCKQLIRSSRDALVALEPNDAEKQAPMATRMVPRHAIDGIETSQRHREAVGRTMSLKDVTA